MKKTIIAAFGVLTLSASMAFAAPPHGPRAHCDGEGMRGEGPRMGMAGNGDHITRMFERLDLSEAQRAEILQLREQFQAETAPQREAMQQNMQALRDAKRAGDQAAIDSLHEKIAAHKAEMARVRESHQAQIHQILTPEQREQMEAMREQRGGKHGRHGGKHGGRNGGPGRF